MTPSYYARTGLRRPPRPLPPPSLPRRAYRAFTARMRRSFQQALSADNADHLDLDIGDL